MSTVVRKSSLPNIAFLQVSFSIYQNVLLLHVCTLHEALTTLLNTYIWAADKPVIHFTSFYVYSISHRNIPMLGLVSFMRSFFCQQVCFCSSESQWAEFMCVANILTDVRGQWCRVEKQEDFINSKLTLYQTRQTYRLIKVILGGDGSKETPHPYPYPPLSRIT